MAKMLGRGSKIYYGDTTGATNFVALPQIESIGEIRKTSPKVAVTDLDNTTEEYLSGLPDPGTIPVVGFWDPQNAVHQQMDTDQRAGTTRYWKVEVRRFGVLVRTGIFQGYVAEFGTGPIENKTAHKMSLSLQMSSDVTWS